MGVYAETESLQMNSGISLRSFVLLSHVRQWLYFLSSSLLRRIHVFGKAPRHNMINTPPTAQGTYLVECFRILHS